MRRMASWETPRMSMASCVIVLWMISLTVCGDTLGSSSNSNLELPSKLPCPDPEVIAPCKCNYFNPYGMDMNCSNVANEDELRRVFSNNFAFTDFRKLTIHNNHNITSLREGDLGAASFIWIEITDTSLSEIEDDALTGSLHTLVTLDISMNSLKSVPDISAFTHLKDLYVFSNSITMFPIQASTTLSFLDLGNNQIDDVPKDAIIALPKLETLYLYEISLTEIHSHTFTRNENLSFLELGQNKLTTIPDDAITLYGQYTQLYLYGNQITNLTYEAVSSVTDWLDVSHNNLTEVPEKVFRPLIEYVKFFYINDNPFKCGCDMAWLVLNQTLLKRLDGLEWTTCSDGEKFEDLDPEIYKVMCPNATAVPLKLQ